MKHDINLVSRIEEFAPKMSKGQKAIAQYIMKQSEQAVFMTAAKLGETVGVSESTVVRFAMQIGYSGYPQFQKELEQWVRGKWNKVREVEVKYGAGTQSELIKSVLEADIHKIEDTLFMMDSGAFETAVNTILEAREVYILGLRSCEPLADFLSFYLQMIRGNVHLIRTTSTSEIFEQMIRMNEEDVLVGISFPRYSMRTLKAMEFANDRNARVIAITDNIHSPMNLYSSCNLFARSDMVSIVDSLVAPLSVLNALVIAMCIKKPVEVEQNLLTLEKTWSEYQVYLNDEIDFLGDQPILEGSLFQPKVMETKKNEEK